MSTGKKVTLLARRDLAEAMRVAAGVTIFGHAVTLVLMRALDEEDALREQLELLELADIEPLSAVASNRFPVVNESALCDLLGESQMVISV